MVKLPEVVPSGVSPRELLPAADWCVVIGEIARRHGLAAHDVQGCSRGSDVVYALGTSAVVKLTAPRWAAELRTESTFLTGLAGRTTFALPEVLGVGDIDGWPYVITSFLDGEHLDDVWPTLTRAARLELARQLGRAMSELHATPVAGLDSSSWADFVQSQRDGVVAHHRQRQTPPRWLDAIEPFLARLPPLYPASAPTVSLHTELLGGHVFVRQDGDHWRISGLIDFADGRVGHPDYDIAALVEFIFGHEPGLLRECLLAYGWSSDRLCDEQGDRLLGCALLHRFASLPRMLQAAGLPSSGPAFFADLRRRLYDLAA